VKNEQMDRVQKSIPSTFPVFRVSCSDEAQSRAHFQSRCPAESDGNIFLFCQNGTKFQEILKPNFFTIPKDIVRCYNFASGNNYASKTGQQSNEIINKPGNIAALFFHFSPDNIDEHRQNFRSVASEYGNDLQFYEMNCLEDQRNNEMTYCDGIFRFKDIFYVFRSPANIVVINETLSKREIEKKADALLEEVENGTPMI
jgi:hypothetical protein